MDSLSSVTIAKALFWFFSVSKTQLDGWNQEYAVLNIFFCVLINILDHACKQSHRQEKQHQAWSLIGRMLFPNLSHVQVKMSHYQFSRIVCTQQLHYTMGKQHLFLSQPYRRYVCKWENKPLRNLPKIFCLCSPVSTHKLVQLLMPDRLTIWFIFLT